MICKAPFVSQAQWTSGYTQMCCNDTEPVLISLEDEWNSPARVETRKQWMDGEIPERCKRCIRNKEGLVEHYEGSIKETAEELMKGCKDGVMEDLPRYLHLSPSNKCQIACRMCNKAASSTFARVYPDIGARYTPDVDPLEVLKWTEKCANSLQSFVFHGGEPMMSPYFNETVGLLPKSVHFCVLGNGMTLETKNGKNAIDLMSRFDTTEFIVSLDGAPLTNDYQRALSKADVIVENVKKLHDRLPDCKIQVNHTLTNISAMGITQFYDYVSKELPFVNYVNHGFVHYPYVYQLHNLPAYLRQKLLKDIDSYDSGKLEGVFEWCWSNAKERIKEQLGANPYDGGLWTDFIKYDNALSNCLTEKPPRTIEVLLID